MTPKNINYLKNIYAFCFEKSKFMTIDFDLTTTMCHADNYQGYSSYVRIKESSSTPIGGKDEFNRFEFFYKSCTDFKFCYALLLEEYKEFLNKNISKRPYLS